MLAPSHPQVQMIDRIAREVKEKTSGRIDVQSFPNGLAAAAETTTAFATTRAITAGTAGTFTARATPKLTLAFAGISRTFAGKFTTLGRRTAGTAGRARAGAAGGTIKRAPIATLGRTAAAVTPRTIFAAFAAAPLVGRRFVLHP
jgi:hypothetical protein